MQCLYQQIAVDFRIQTFCGDVSLDGFWALSTFVLPSDRYSLSMRACVRFQPTADIEKFCPTGRHLWSKLAHERSRESCKTDTPPPAMPEVDEADRPTPSLARRHATVAIAAFAAFRLARTRVVVPTLTILGIWIPTSAGHTADT